jgi:hypothetical protein
MTCPDSSSSTRVPLQANSWGGGGRRSGEGKGEVVEEMEDVGGQRGECEREERCEESREDRRKRGREQEEVEERRRFVGGERRLMAGGDEINDEEENDEPWRRDRDKRALREREGGSWERVETQKGEERRGKTNA